MAFLERILEPPSYGWKDQHGELVQPTSAQLWREFSGRLNVLADRKNWLALTCWGWVFCLAPFAVLFFTHFFSFPLLMVGFLYAVVAMGTHGTIWYHRYCTHRAYTFSHPFWRFVTRNLTIKAIPEEIYVVSHHVHHAMPEQPGDPYNALAGGLYCFLADANHQPIARTLSEKDYARVTRFLDHTGVHINSYAQYQRWGSVCHPGWTMLHWVLNWGFWFSVFTAIGGLGLAVAMFGGAFVWAIGVRTFNYDGHGQGKDKRRDGVDFNRRDLSINQYWSGIVAGEWHNNHHLYPNSARSGFLPHQIDFAWLYIRTLYRFGAVSSYKDSRDSFMEKHYLPYIAEQEGEGAASIERKATR
ncbi:MAG: fatty acid desaturase [Myxococcota bacterium]